MERFLAFLVLSSVTAWGSSVLVAPFANRTTEPNLDWIGESLSEAAREALAAAGVEVTPRPERQEALRRLALPATGQITIASGVRLAEQVQARVLVTGQFELMAAPEGSASRGSLRVTARAIDLEQVTEKAEFAETGALEDLGRIQSNLAYQLVRSIEAKSLVTREEFDRRHPPVKITALENYIRGLMAGTAEQRHRFFTQAYRLDGTLWQPCLHLGRMHYEQENYREAAGWLEKVGPGWPESGEVMFLLGVSRFQTGDFEGALRAFETLAQGSGNPDVINNLGAAQLKLGQASALDNFRRALAADATDPDYHFNTGYALWKRGDFEEAADRFRAVLDREPGDQDAILLLGRCLKRSGPRTGDLRAENLERIKDVLEAR